MKCLSKIQKGSLITLYTRYICFLSGPFTSKSSRHVRSITQPRCLGFCWVICLSVSLSCRASSTLLLLMILTATGFSDCHLKLTCGGKVSFCTANMTQVRAVTAWVSGHLETSRASYTQLTGYPQPILTSSSNILANTSPGFAG